MDKTPIKPKRPMTRIIREGASNFCECGSSAYKSGFMGWFGELLCDNDECPNSKKRFK